MSILFFGYFLVRFAIIKYKFSIGSSSDKISSLRTVLKLDDEAGVGFIRFDKLVRRAIIAFDCILVAGHH